MDNNTERMSMMANGRTTALSVCVNGEQNEKKEEKNKQTRPPPTTRKTKNKNMDNSTERMLTMDNNKTIDNSTECMLTMGNNTERMSTTNDDFPYQNGLAAWDTEGY